MSVAEEPSPAAGAPQVLRVLFVGFGSANRALAALLLEKAAALPFRLAVVGVLTGRSGCLVAERGAAEIDLASALREAKVEACAGATPGGLSAGDTVALIARLRAASRLDVVVEAIPTDRASGEPALAFARAALRGGASVVTANKAPVAIALDELLAIARAHGGRYLHEAACMDGVPIFNMARHCLPHARILGFEGILNSTTNVVLEQLERDPRASFDAAVRMAQDMGIAEADPGADVDGWDAAVKCVCLARALGLAPEAALRDVSPVEGVRGLDGDAVREKLPSRFKLVCRGRRGDDGRIQLSVQRELVGPASPLHAVCGSSSCVTLRTDVLGPLTLVQSEPTIRDTGYGLFADLCEAARAVKGAAACSAESAATKRRRVE